MKISCEFYHNCNICKYNNRCYFKSDEIAFIIDKLAVLYFELEQLFEIRKHKYDDTHYIPTSINEINFRINSIRRDILNLKKNMRL